MVERSPSNYNHKKSVLPKKARTFFLYLKELVFLISKLLRSHTKLLMEQFDEI